VWIYGTCGPAGACRPSRFCVAAILHCGTAAAACSQRNGRVGDLLSVVVHASTWVRTVERHGEGVVPHSAPV
jgi:hypothetical protein